MDVHHLVADAAAIVAADHLLETNPCFRQNVMPAATSAKFLSVLQVKSLCIAVTVSASKLLILEETIDLKEDLNEDQKEAIIKMACAKSWQPFKANLMPSSPF